MWNLHRIFSLFRCPWGKRRMADVSYLYDHLSSKMSMCFEESRAVGIFMVGCTCWTLGPTICVHFLISSHSSERADTITQQKATVTKFVLGHAASVGLKKWLESRSLWLWSRCSLLIHVDRERDLAVVRMFPFFVDIWNVGRNEDKATLSPSSPSSIPSSLFLSSSVSTDEVSEPARVSGSLCPIQHRLV